MLRDEWTWSTQGHNVSHSVKQGKSVHPPHHPPLKDHYLVRADMQRSSQSLRVAFRRDGSVPNWQLGNRSQGWYGGLNGDLPTHTHTNPWNLWMLPYSDKSVFAGEVTDCEMRPSSINWVSPHPMILLFSLILCNPLDCSMPNPMTSVFTRDTYRRHTRKDDTKTEIGIEVMQT